MKQEWRTIEGFPDYQISNDGQIKSYRRKYKDRDITEGRIMRLQVDKYYKPSANLVRSDGKRFRKYVHIEMARAFREDYFEGCYISMADGDDMNLTVENLVIETVTDNRKRRMRSGAMRGVESMTRRKLSRDEKKVIENEVKKGLSNSEIARNMELSRRTIMRVKNTLEKRGAL